MDILDFIGRNQGAFMVSLTAIYVLATILYVWTATRTTKEMRRSNELLLQSLELTQQTIKQNLDFERLRNRPYIIFDFISEDQLFFAVVKNIGRHPAYDVNISSEPPILRVKSSARKEISFLKFPISFLPPGREIKDFIDVTPDFLSKHESTLFQITLVYREDSGTTYNESINIKLDYFSKRIIVRKDDLNKNLIDKLDNISKGIDKLNTNIYRFSDKSIKRPFVFRQIMRHRKRHL